MKYKVTLNGKTYEIEVEAGKAMLLDEYEAIVPSTPAPVAAGAQTISAPMPGTILKVNVANGQAVKKGDVLMVLEAMKMENEIMAPNDGTVTSVNVNAGASVEAGTVLCTLA